MLFSPKRATDINAYDKDAVTRIDIEDIAGNRTIIIDNRDEIEYIIKLLRGTYEVTKISKSRESDIFVKNPLILMVNIYQNQGLEIVDQYFFTSFNTIGIPDIKTMVGTKRTETYESLDEQHEIFESLKKVMEDDV